METKQVKNFYNTALTKSDDLYENDRWFKSDQSKSAFFSTLSAVKKYALPHIQNGMEVFELGPGPGTWTKVLLEKAPEARYNLVDISDEMLKQAKMALDGNDNIGYTTSDILDFQSEKKYDFFFSSRMMEYVPKEDKAKAVATICEAMSSGAYGYIVTKTPQYARLFSKKVQAPIHSQQISSSELIKLFKENNCVVTDRVHVTCVFPKLRSGALDTILTKVVRFIPFKIGSYVSESYAVVFKKL